MALPKTEMGLSLQIEPLPISHANLRSHLLSSCNRTRFLVFQTLTLTRTSPPRKPIANCRCNRDEIGNAEWLSTASPYQVLGIDESFTAAELKAAFRARVKEFHPDVCRDIRDSDAIIRRVIQAYEILCRNIDRGELIKSDCSDPFEVPECEALDLFVNETLCIGKGCPYSCVKRAPHAFSFVLANGTARAISQGHGEDFQVQLAVGQCPRNCIHYVTPSQRIILEELLESVLNSPYDLAEATYMDSLIVKAKFENNRYRRPKKQSKSSSQYVDWY